MIEHCIDRALIEHCKVLTCRVPIGGARRFEPLDNTPCGGNNRCFRGRYLKKGSLIKNVGDGRCLKATEPFSHNSPIELVKCPQSGTPLDRFVISDQSIGKTFATPWASRDATEQGDKCIWTGNAEGNRMFTDRCNPGNPWHRWDFIDVGNEEFLISHRVSRRCAKAEGNSVRTFGKCDRNDRNMRWRFH